VAEQSVSKDTEQMTTSQLEHDFANSIASVSGAASTIVAYRNRLDGHTIELLAQTIVDQANRMHGVFHALLRTVAASMTDADSKPVIDLRDESEPDVRLA